MAWLSQMMLDDATGPIEGKGKKKCIWPGSEVETMHRGRLQIGQLKPGDVVRDTENP